MSRSNLIDGVPASRMRRLATPLALRVEVVTLVALVLVLGRLVPSFGDLLHGVAKSLFP